MIETKTRSKASTQQPEPWRLMLKRADILLAAVQQRGRISPESKAHINAAGACMAIARGAEPGAALDAGWWGSWVNGAGLCVQGVEAHRLMQQAKEAGMPARLRAYVAEGLHQLERAFVVDAPEMLLTGVCA